MIAAARSGFSVYRFDDGGGSVCLRALSFLGGLGVGCLSCLVPTYSWPCVSHLTWRVDVFSFLARARIISSDVASLTFPSSASLGGVICPGCLSSFSSSRHHLVRRGRSFLSSSCSASSHRCPLFSSWAAIVRRTAGVASHPPLPRSRMSWGKRRGM